MAVEKKERKVSLITPKKGQKEKLLDLAGKKCGTRLSRIRRKSNARKQKPSVRSGRLKELLGIPSH